MKVVLTGTWLLFFVFSISLTLAQNGNSVQADWLKGRWKRTDTPAGQTSFESWWQTASGKWKGIGVTIQEGDTVFVEKLKLEASEGKLYYVAEVDHNDEPTYFKIDLLKENRLICVNPQHDFPQKIEYQRKGSELIAVISGNGKTRQFRFVKLPDR